jgi:DNA modification methylase
LRLTGVWQPDWDGKARVLGNEHPTQKPVELFAIPMSKHTPLRDIRFEPLCGSASQIIAGEQWGRVVHSTEIKPISVDITVKIWERFSGGHALRKSDH